MNNTIRSNLSSCSCDLIVDPYERKQYLACLQNFDTKEISDGYTMEEVEELIEFLTKIKQELSFKNTTLTTLPLYTGVTE